MNKIPEALRKTHSWTEVCSKIMRETKLDSPKFNDWLMRQENYGGPFFDSLMYKKLFRIHNKTQYANDDEFIIVSGQTGVGKSTLALQMALVLDPTFSTERIIYSYLDFLKAVKKSKPNQVLMIDEGNLVFFSRESMTAKNKKMLKLLALMRQKRLVTIVCVPDFKTIDTYPRKNRIDFLVYCKKRGTYSGYYTPTALRVINEALDRGVSMNKIRVPSGNSWLGYWNKQIPNVNGVNWADYSLVKSGGFDEFLDELINEQTTKQSSPEWLKISDAQKIMKLKSDTYIKFIKEGKLQGKKFGNTWFVHKSSLKLPNPLENGGK